MKILLLLTIIFTILYSTEASSQDTLCYEEINRLHFDSLYLSFNVAPSYNNNYLFYVERKGDSICIVKYNGQDIYKSSLMKIEYNFYTVGSCKNGNPFILLYDSHIKDRKGKSHIITFDSLLNKDKEYSIAKINMHKYNEEVYRSIKYLDTLQDSIILNPSFYGGFIIKFNKTTFSNDLVSYPYDYDFYNSEFVSIRGLIGRIEEKRVYYYKEGITLEGIKKGLINKKTLFIKNGFVTQLDNKDIVFFKFCD